MTSPGTISTFVDIHGNVGAEMTSGSGERAFEAQVIADSVNCGDARITTLAVRLPRFVLSELNTHRVFSRNSSSSRARPVSANIRDVLDNPVVPEVFTGNRRGMQGDDGDRVDQAFARRQWLRNRDHAVASALSLILGREVEVCEIDDVVSNGITVIDGVSVHKEYANRLLEPFMWHTALVTSDDWDNFFDLRISEWAQPEIRKAAEVMLTAMDVSTPTETSVHIPFVDDADVSHMFDDTDTFRTVILESVARCARTSYTLYTGENPNADADIRLATSLLERRHMSPFEHVAFKGWCIPDVTILFAANGPLDAFHGNFSEWFQLRKFVERNASVLTA